MNLYLSNKVDHWLYAELVKDQIFYVNNFGNTNTFTDAAISYWRILI